MPRIRTVKPELFDDPDVGSLPAEARWLFVGLLTQADRAGRLVEDQRRLKARLCAYDERMSDLEPHLCALTHSNLLIRYTYEGQRYLQIRTFEKHQRPHPKEPASVIPPPPKRRSVKRHGASRQNTANPPLMDSGSLDTGSLESGVLENGVPPFPPDGGFDLERAYRVFTAQYPASRRVGGEQARRAFRKAIRGPNPSGQLDTMLAALEQHKRSEQWTVKRMVPLMTTWLNQERWQQELPEPSRMGGSAKTAGNQAALERFVARVGGGHD